MFNSVRYYINYSDDFFTLCAYICIALHNIKKRILYLIYSKCYTRLAIINLYVKAVIGDPTDSTGVAYDDENGTPPNPQPTNPPPPSNPPLKDVICCIDTNNPDFKTVPVECTAIASYAQNYGGKNNPIYLQ